MEKKYQLLYYIDPSTGQSPAQDWIFSLRETKVRAIIRARLSRAENGNLGDFKSLGDGIFEFRIFIGPGYRLYFAIERSKIILLLVGGDKSTQFQDIRKAKIFWENHKLVNKT